MTTINFDATARRENAIFSLGGLNQRYYSLLEYRIEYFNKTAREDVIALSQIISVLKTAVEVAKEIDWDVHSYENDLKHYEKLFKQLEPKCDYKIGEISINDLEEIV